MTAVPTGIVPRPGPMPATTAAGHPVTAAPVIPKRPSGPSGPKVMDISDIGCGKTHKLGTLSHTFTGSTWKLNAPDRRVETFIIATEPGIESVLGETDPEWVHWHYLPPTPMNWDILLSQATSVNTKDFKGLCNENPSRNEFRQMLDLIRLCKDFRCDRTGKSYGDVASWGPDRAFAIDTMSGLTQMAINSWMGTRIAADLPDYQVIQKLLQNLIVSFTSNLRCWFILTGHAEKEMNETQGMIQQTISTYGRKLAPILGRTFDEVVMSKQIQDGPTTKYVWSNNERAALLKKRFLPLGSSIPPDYQLLLTEWRKRTSQPI